MLGRGAAAAMMTNWEKYNVGATTWQSHRRNPVTWRGNWSHSPAALPPYRSPVNLPRHLRYHPQSAEMEGHALIGRGDRPLRRLRAVASSI